MMIAHQTRKNELTNNAHHAWPEMKRPTSECSTFRKCCNLPLLTVVLWSESVRKGSGDSHSKPQRRDVGTDAEAVSNIISLVQAPDVKEEVRGQIKTWKAQASAVRRLPFVSRVVVTQLGVPILLHRRGRQAIFVGAIQAQLLDTNAMDSPLRIATNILFLTGIVFNVTGAYFALMAASALETDLNNLNAELNYLKDGKLQDMFNFEDLTTLAKRFVRPHYHDDGSGSGSSGAVYGHLALEQHCLSVKRNQAAGKLGSWAITVGFLTCLVALGCLAWKTIAMGVAASVVISLLLVVRLALLFMHRKPGDII